MKYILNTLMSVFLLFLIACVPEASKKCKENQTLVNGSCVLKEQPAVVVPTPLPTLAPASVPTPTLAPTPTILPQLSCGNIASGTYEHRTMYQVEKVNEGNNCIFEVQNRICINGQLGNWSGTFAHPQCTLSRIRYNRPNVQGNENCNSETQSMTCIEGICGVWYPNNFIYSACSSQTGSLNPSPSITQISGVINNGEILTITGTGFKEHADYNVSKNYLIAGFEDFEIGMADPMFKGNYGPELVTDTTLQRTNSKYAAKGYYWNTPRTYTNVWGRSINTSKMYGFHLPLPSLQKKIFISGWFMFPEGFDTGIRFDTTMTDQTKFLCMTPVGVLNGSDGGKTYFQTRKGAVIIPLRTETEDRYLSEGDSDPLFNYAPMGTWHRYDIYVDLTKPEGKKIHNWFVDGLKIPRKNQYYNTDVNLLEQGILGGFNYLSWLMFQFQGSDDPAWPQYMDDAFANLTLARVEISTSPVWDESKQTHKEIQIPLTWTNNKIMIQTNMGALDKHQDLYLYVITDDGSVSVAKRL